MDENIYNRFAWSAAHFEKKEELDAILEKKSHDIDLQVYFKCLLSHFEPEITTEQKEFADQVIQNHSKPTEQKKKKKVSRRPRRNSDDEVVDVDYEDLNLERAMNSVGGSYDPMTQKFMKERTDLYSANIDKAGNKLRMQNFKNKKQPIEN